MNRLVLCGMRLNRGQQVCTGNRFAPYDAWKHKDLMQQDRYKYTNPNRLARNERMTMLIIADQTQSRGRKHSCCSLVCMVGIHSRKAYIILCVRHIYLVRPGRHAQWRAVSGCRPKMSVRTIRLFPSCRSPSCLEAHGRIVLVLVGCTYHYTTRSTMAADKE